ncbi:aspartate/methionine/tyrosine aminotransferase [Asanoa ferruginea]|uniref:Aminotransferase n=1 Tax=Asanoa ferruginea TaxID=53367 RepID=A0A3D9ZST7_9ACTN|nr:pyridoxal phosphate-dependent aminotransferase [Asanoa ferruginea]REG00266.1 aspartate/methionine/tyrosine aminotransferase [Asanoa ferruginea]GIF53702.1 aminotransferase [Asanoa ferruginea]
MDRFPPAPMADLVDVPCRYDLAESTSPPLLLGELLTPSARERLDKLSIGYGTTPGDAELRTLVAKDLGVDPDQVLLTTGGVGAMFLLAFVTLEAGDHAVVTTPCFPPARAVLESLRAEVTAVPLSFDAGYRLDVEAVLAAVRPRTRLVSLASPQNPSGVRMAASDLADLVAGLARVAPDAVVLVDETYRDGAYDDDAVPASAASLGPQVVTTSSLSKAYGAPGLRVGWLTATSVSLYERLRRVKFNTLISASGVDELLAVEVLRQRSRVLGERRAVLRAALATLSSWAATQPLVALLPPDAGALCCLRLAPSVSPDLFYSSLAALDTRVARGSWFFESDRVFRVGFGHLPPDLFAEGLERVGSALALAH